MRRHRKREIREDDFSFASDGGLCSVTNLRSEKSCIDKIFHSSAAYRSASARRHRKREIREDDFSFASDGGLCSVTNLRSEKSCIDKIFHSSHSSHEERNRIGKSAGENPFSPALLYVGPFRWNFLHRCFLMRVMQIVRLHVGKGEADPRAGVWGSCGPAGCVAAKAEADPRACVRKPKVRSPGST